ncbi:heterokaryon incompatibility protein-domain-containing protein [Microdochium trichocladiopsis]|uniref:Heterokaryon incompatibility protein-domain-containing protein n=1 Tax=Microdochium trichocladiopsis TaxID=1682393 RepID=A0A9P8XVB0_9PEZI|nr:heterokaryon incompatibility protein-domain-containing protein [Microdochium trichocladiopsis]KAH7017991.1 heterokaryon incompatibility protein-domain-containing protein [Microdochium trichocladiopsis]
MRLLHTSRHRLEDKAPGSTKYAILSHVWDKRELLYSDLVNPDKKESWKTKKHASKVLQACALARADGYEYIWIDNCCIDKSSSAELSEAINSMYSWYSLADVCYAYLFGVLTELGLSKSKWFERGWTLQELIAPKTVKFYGKTWNFLGTRGFLAARISKITQIPGTLLTDRYRHMEEMAALHILHTTSIAKRMSWAKSRETTREEDLAYCLMGIFGVNMPLLYGEGGQRAFMRLQEEIMRRSGDQSILVHTWPSLLSPGPRHFKGDVSISHQYRKSAISFSDGDLALDVLLCTCTSAGRVAGQAANFLAILNCSLDEDDHLGRPALVVQRIDKQSERFKVVEYADGKRLLVVRRNGTLISYSSRTIDNQNSIDNWDLTHAISTRIVIEMPDDHPLPDHSSMGSMVVRFRPSDHVQRRYTVVSTAPKADGDFLISSNSSVHERDSRYLFDDHNKSEWLGVMLLTINEAARARTGGVDGPYYILVWGRRYKATAPGSASAEHHGKHSGTPWCKILRPPELQNQVDSEIVYAPTPSVPSASGTSSNGARLPFNIVQELQALPFAPNHVLWHESRFSTVSDDTSSPVSSQSQQRQRRQMGSLLRGMQRLCHDAETSSVASVGAHSELIAGIEPVTFLGNTVYDLHLDVSNP